MNWNASEAPASGVYRLEIGNWMRNVGLTPKFNQQRTTGYKKLE
jgi:hypothetical protein